MADLFKSEFEEIRLRRSVQDGETLIALLDIDGSISVVDDPSAKEVEEANAKLAKLNEAEAAKAAEEAPDTEVDEKLAKEKLELAHVASFPIAAASEEEEPEAEPKAKAAKEE